MLWVLKRTVSMRRFFWAPKTYVLNVVLEIIYNFTLKNFVYLNLCIIDGYFLVPILSLQMGSSLTGLGTRLHDVWYLIVHLSYAVCIRMIWYMWPNYTFFLRNVWFTLIFLRNVWLNQTFLKKLSVIRTHIPKAEILKLVWRWMANCNISMCMETVLNYDIYITSILAHGHCAFFTVWCTCVRSIRCSIKKRCVTGIVCLVYVYWKEPSQWDGCFEHLKQMIRKIFTFLLTIILFYLDLAMKYTGSMFKSCNKIAKLSWLWILPCLNMFDLIRKK